MTNVRLLRSSNYMRTGRKNKKTIKINDMISSLTQVVRDQTWSTRLEVTNFESTVEVAPSLHESAIR